MSNEWSPFQNQKFAQWVLSNVRQQKSDLKQTLYYIIENILLLLYCHLNSFLRGKKASDPKRDSMRAVHIADSISPEQQDTLIREVTATLINDPILDNLLKIPSMGEPMINVLVTKLKTDINDLQKQSTK